MDIQEFVVNFSEQLEDTDPSTIKSGTKFREEIEEWDSLAAMSVIAMVDEKYGVTLTGEEIRNSNTVNDLFNLVKNKKQ